MAAAAARRSATQRRLRRGARDTTRTSRRARVPRVRSFQTDRVCARSTTRRARYDGGDKGRDGGWEMPDGRRSCARGACPSGFAFPPEGCFGVASRFARPSCERALTRTLLCPPSRFKPIPAYAHGLQNRRRAHHAPPRAAAAPTTTRRAGRRPAAAPLVVVLSGRGVKTIYVGAGIRELFAFEILPTAK